MLQMYAFKSVLCKPVFDNPSSNPSVLASKQNCHRLLKRKTASLLMFGGQQQHHQNQSYLSGYTYKVEDTFLTQMRITMDPQW